MSSHLKSEGIYANSYEDCLATLFCWFGCYQICFFHYSLGVIVK